MYYAEAIKKINKCNPTGQKEKAIKYEVIMVLSDFCRQEPEFAQAIVQSDKTMDDCLKYCVKDASSCISDLEVYKRASEFWFETAKVSMELKIDLVGDSDSQTPSVLDLSFDDLFD